ncbi:MAG: DUF1501 domain-containing protein [Verrucomicrobiota bacterium]|nr:DUF1501 domain-containing protein [Verrucomicrobiota bacterium]
MKDQIYCDGIMRRDFLKIGALAGAGFALPNYYEASSTDASKGKSKSAIYIRLAGGPSHMDSFDMKPDAPDTHRGEFKEISTNIPGTRISEHLPKMAKCADKYSILRGVSHSLAAHRLGSEYLMTGNRPLPSLKYPTFGAVLSKELESSTDIPRSVAIPKGPTAPTGFLGLEFGPLETGTSPKAGEPMDIRGLSLSNGLTLEDIDRRNDLVKRYDTAFGEFANEDKILSGMDEFSQKAYQMMRSNRTREAFDLTKESPGISNMFGNSSFSQSCLLATRLIESGVRLVSIQLGGWDTHRDNFSRLKDNNLPNLDDGISGLLQALAAKHLLESTSVFVTGEFGRTPKINPRGGRDHYPRAMFCLLAGGGMKGGQLIGASDSKGEGPQDRVITPDDVAATFYHSLGIDHTKEYHTPTGRPVMIVRNGKVIPELS